MKKKLTLFTHNILGNNFMIKYIFGTGFMLISFNIFAQEGQVTIDQDPKLKELHNLYVEVNSNSEDYYQIQVGFVRTDSQATRLKSQVEIDFPGWPTKIDFQEPTYRVKVGKFKNALEAERRFIEVRKKYPNAMLLRPENSTW